MKKEKCEHKTFESFWDEESNFITYTCDDCGEEFYEDIIRFREVSK